MSVYGRNRQSITDIEQQLQIIFNDHPDSFVNDAGDPVIPADALVDVLRAFSEVYDGVELMTDSETKLLNDLLRSNPGLEVTPAILVRFIAEKTKQSPPRSPQTDDQADLPGRGRTGDREIDHHRSSSNESNGDSTLYSSGSRRSSTGPPETPSSGKSVFDTERRQRSTPLSTNAPSSWNKRPAPAHRRKSDAGSRSDSESFSESPSAFGRAPGRMRTPSNPTSPSSLSADLSAFSPLTSPRFGRPPSRPHSRASSQPQTHFNYHSPNNDRGYSSPEDGDPTIDANPLYDYRGKLRRDDGFTHSISSLPMPRTGSDSDEEDSVLGLVLDRSMTSSTASLQEDDRMEALTRMNAELRRKLMDAEKTLQNRLSEHESELEELQGRLEEMRSELSATKREEKELRSKERQNMTQIGALEIEIAKVSKALEHARTTYSSLQRQYQEQCTASEKYRDDLRQREELIRNLREAASLHEVENAKWAKEHENYETRIAALENELAIAQQAHVQLDEQKQENLLLKETIDRMRFDMDEMRNSAVAATGGSGQSSATNTMSKSLGAELMGKMKGGWGMQDEGEDATDEEVDVSAEAEEDEETESEDVIQTIITRKKRKVASRANQLETKTFSFEESKEYSDSATQYEPTLFSISSTTQTDPPPKIIRQSLSTQTEGPSVEVLAVQTDPETIPIPRVTLEMAIQTDEIHEEPSRSPSPHTAESMASSSSTIVPPTPKAHPQPLESAHSDLPPAYNQINPREQEEHDLRVVTDALQKWHPGAEIPFAPKPGGIAEESVEEWKAFNRELGVGCMVIDKIIERSEKTSGSRSSKTGKARQNRFYNIYNTYIYGEKGLASGFASQTALLVGASALMLLAIGQFRSPAIYSIPGGPTYYDRQAWKAFNTMQMGGEGFGYDDTAAVWAFLGRVGGGAARIARGWPT